MRRCGGGMPPRTQLEGTAGEEAPGRTEKERLQGSGGWGVTRVGLWLPVNNRWVRTDRRAEDACEEAARPGSAAGAGAGASRREAA